MTKDKSDFYMLTWQNVTNAEMDILDALPEDQAEVETNKLYQAFNQIFPEVVGQVLAQLRAAGGEPRFVQNNYMQSIAFKEGQTETLRHQLAQDPHTLIFPATADFYNDPDAYCEREYGTRMAIPANLSPDITPKLP